MTTKAKLNADTQINMMLLLGATSAKFEESIAKGKEEKQATSGQLKYYSDLCEQKGQAPNPELTSSTGIDKEIKRLKDLPYWKELSEKQVERITELCELMNLPVPDLSKLNGAYNASGSQFIQKLKEMSKNIVLPITEKQLIMVQQMNLCPSNPHIDEPEKMSSKEAGEHISKYKGDFYVWKKDRLTDSQLHTILQLSCRNESVDVSDILSQTGLSTVERVALLLPKQSLTYDCLIQLSQKTATAFIEEMEVELKDAGLIESTLEPEEMRAMKTTEDEDIRKELRKLVTNLYASIGQDIEQDFYETLDWDGLKELCDFVRMFEVNVEGLLDESEIFTADQKNALLA